MAVTLNGNIYEKTNAGYWVSFNPLKIERPVVKGGYLAAGKVYSTSPIVDFDTLAAPPDGLIDTAMLSAFNGNELAAFIYKLYQAELFVETGQSINLHDDIVAAGLYDPPTSDPYEGIRPLDFMALTGAKVVPEGIATYIPQPGATEPPPARPNLWEVEDGDADARESMFSVIKFMGIWGILKHLYIVKGGITWEEFIKCIWDWMPEREDRKQYYSVYRKFLVSRSAPLPTQKQINEFIG